MHPVIYYILKVAITAGLIIAVSEISKRAGYLGGLLASLPLISYLAMVWIYVEEGEKQPIADLAMGVFWFVLPTLPFFLALTWLLKHLSFPASLALATLVMLAFYGLTMFALDKAGIQVA